MKKIREWKSANKKSETNMVFDLRKTTQQPLAAKNIFFLLNKRKSYVVKEW